MVQRQGVELELYIKSMTSMWRKYGITPSRALKEAWEIMADTFNRHIKGDAVEEWSVLGLPTGSGKTQGLAVYCASLEEHPGILIITRFTKQADELAATINRLAKKEIAHARHDKNKGASKQELMNFPVLVITHATYSRVLKGAAMMEGEGKLPWSWPIYHNWKNGARRLTVIDETLNAIEPIKVELDDLRLVAGSIPFDIEKQYPKETGVLAQLLEVLTGYADRQDENKIHYIRPWSWQRREKGRLVNLHDLTPLINALEHHEAIGYDLQRGDEAAAKEKSFKTALRERQIKALNHLKEIVLSDSLYAAQGKSRAVCMARVMLPTHINSAVILDATALQSYVYNMQGSFIKHQSLPNKIRSYRNVTLHIHYGVAVGKTSLSGKTPDFFLSLLEELQPAITNKRVLVCVHKAKRKELEGPLKKKYPKAEISHWGDIDGKNEWGDCDTIVLCGLQYLGFVNAECAVLAYEEWHKKGNQQHNPDVTYDDESRTMDIPTDDDGTAHGYYGRSHIAVSVIQAINRVRCRKPIDAQGNCQTTDVHIFLHKQGGVDEQHLIESIREAMPDIQVIEDEVSGELKPGKLTAQEAKIIRLFEDLARGQHPSRKVYQRAAARGIPERTLQRKVQEMTDNPESFFSRRARETRVTYKGERGKYSQSHFVRA